MLFINLGAVIYFVGTLVLVILLSVAGFILLVGLMIFCHRLRLKIVKEREERLAGGNSSLKRAYAFGSPGRSRHKGRSGHSSRKSHSSKHSRKKNYS